MDAPALARERVNGGCSHADGKGDLVRALMLAGGGKPNGSKVKNAYGDARPGAGRGHTMPHAPSSEWTSSPADASIDLPAFVGALVFVSATWCSDVEFNNSGMLSA